MVSPTQWTWVWASSGSWWWTGKPGVLQPMGSQRVGHDWVTELNWTSSEFCMKLKSSYQLCDHHHKAWLAREWTSKLTCVAVDHRFWNSACGILHRTAHSVTPGFLQSELSKKGGRAKENKVGATVLFIISLRTDISSLWYSTVMNPNLGLVWEELHTKACEQQELGLTGGSFLQTDCHNIMIRAV